jgi:hypothetical protein
MDVKNDISEELRLLSAVVAAISRQTPYEVPEGYFLDLSARVLQQVSGQYVGGQHVRGQAESKPLTFSVPEGYFEGLAQQVLNRIRSGATMGIAADAGATLNVAADAGGQGDGDPYSSILTEAGRRTPYSVPNGYFEANVPLLAVARAINPYTVPADYFERQAPLLAVARSGNPYTVPAGYFDEQATADRVAAAMNATVHASTGGSGAKEIVLGVRRMSWMKYAAAAVVAGFIVTVGLLRIHTARDKQVVPIDIAKTMSTVSDQELQNFLTVQGASFEQPTGTASASSNDGDLKSLLGNVPDGELKQYMEEHGGANDIATN